MVFFCSFPTFSAFFWLKCAFFVLFLLFCRCQITIANFAKNSLWLYFFFFCFSFFLLFSLSVSLSLSLSVLLYAYLYLRLYVLLCIYFVFVSMGVFVSVLFYSRKNIKKKICQNILSYHYFFYFQNVFDHVLNSFFFLLKIQKN